MAKRTLLVVDDEKILRLLRDYLKAAGYRVLTACDGCQALALARQAQPDLIVLDVMLPGIDGFEVCQALRSEGSRVPVVMLTARVRDGDREMALALGVAEFVEKPFSPRELVGRVHELLEGGRLAESQVAG